MKIGWVRMSQTIELDYRFATQPGIEERQGLMKELVRAGHKIVIFSQIKNSHEELLDDPPKGLSWLRRVTFDYEGFPVEHKCDFLIVETGPDTMQYMHRPTDEPFIRRMIRVVDGHEGVYFYYHTDPLLPFPLDQIAGRKYPWGHKKNGYTNEDRRKKHWVKNSCWGTYDEMFHGKTFCMLHRADNPQAYLEVYGGSRACFQKYPIVMKHFPIAVDFAFRRHLTVKAKPEHIVVYAGSDRGRRRAFNRLYGQLALKGMPIQLTGKWSLEHLQKYPTMSCTGWLKFFWMIDRVVNNSYATIQLQSDRSHKMGWASMRPLEAIAEGCIALYDAEATSSCLPLGVDYAVKDSEDAYRKLNKIKKMGQAKRIKHNRVQFSRIRRFTFKNQAQALIRIYKECQ